MSSGSWLFVVYATSIFLILLPLLYIYSLYKLNYWKRRGIKSPKTHWLFGNFKDVILLRKPAGQVLEEIYNWSDPDDNYIGFYIFHEPVLIVKDIRWMKQIFVQDFHIFPNRRFGGSREKDSVGFVNLLSIREPRWKGLRMKITPSVTGQKLKKFIPLILKCQENLFEFFHKRQTENDGEICVELKETFSRFTCDVIASIVFGVDTNSFDKDDDRFFQAGQRILSGLIRGIVLTILFFVPRLSGFIGPLTTGPAEFFREIFHDSISTREKNQTKRGDLIDFFINLKNESPSSENSLEFKNNEDNLVSQAVAFFVAGFEATSTGIAFALFELARHPEYQFLLFEEIERILKQHNGELSWECINEMPFLDCFINETLRLYPPLPFIDRISTTDYELPGTNVILEKNTSIYVTMYGSNKDPKYFPNPLTFDPNRETIRNKTFPTLAFGLGPRSCVGQRIGQLITKLSIIQIVQKYKIFEIREAGSTKLNPMTVFTNPVNGINVNLKLRND